MINKELQKQLAMFPDDLDVVIWHDQEDNNIISWVDESGAKGEYAELVIATNNYERSIL